MRKNWLLAAAVSGLMLGGAARAAEGALQHQTGELRGFGRIAFSAESRKQGADEVSSAIFRCESPEKAKITGSKYLADLLAYGAVKELPADPALGGTLLEVRHGGCWLLGLNGNEFRVDHAPTLAALKAMARPRLEPVPRAAYPAYLDNFDNAGLGIWWMATTKSPEQVAWMKQFPAIPNLHDQRLDNTPAVGVYDVSGVENAMSQVRPIGKNYRHMLWTGPGENTWYGSFVTFPGEAIDKGVPGFTGRRYFEAGGYGSSQAASELVNALQIDTLVNTMKKRLEDPRILAWMEPHGEFHLTDPVAYPPNCRTRFPEFLKNEKKYTLAQLNERYGTKYGDFKELPFPDTAYFAGRRGAYLDLDAVPWRWQGGTLEEGEKAGYARPDFDDSGWFRALRENKHLLSYFDNNTRVSPLWGRGTVEVPAAFLADGKPVWCYIQPYTEHAGRPLALWINGEEIGRDAYDRTNYINKNTAFEVGKFLKPGANRFVVHSNGGRIAYRMFLSKCPPESYPFKDAKLNALYLDWRDYLIHEKLLTLEQYLKVMRALDPNRPIKVMTPHLFQSEAMDLLADYGGYPQLTGEGGWYRPMHYKGYSRLRGLPGSSEPGGPQTTAPATQMMFAVMFWESQDCHDYVFDLNRELWQHKEALKWWNEHAAFLATLGKVDYVEPKLGLLRDVRQSERYQNGGIWNWDMSRGPLPALGLTPVLVDGPDLMKGLAADCPVLLDCATTVMEPALVEAIREYVKNGGIFIAQHHTGQHGELAPDSWPLAAAFGLKITPKWVTLENYHKWPLETIRFTKEQTLLPSLRGKSIRGSGVSIDYMDNQRTGGVQISGEPARPIAHWEDGSIAVAEVPYGKGKFILLGSPFYLRMQDGNGKWSNEQDRQELVAEMLDSCGVKRETDVSEPTIWFEKRASKNGLYDVYFAGALGVRGKWDLNQRIKSQLTAQTSGPKAAVETGTDDLPEVPTQFREGTLSFGEQTFSPFQIRQFAVVRDRVGTEGPAHWLAVQERTWRPLKEVDPAVLTRPLELAADFAREQGEEGIDLNSGWELKIDDAAEWVPGTMGSWSAIGHNDAERIVYRRTVELPESWRRNARVTLGMVGYWTMGMQGDCTLKVNGKVWPVKSRGNFTLDLTEPAAGGKLDLEFTVVGPKPGPFITRGPAGTLYLRRSPQPRAVIPLDGEFEAFERWATNEFKPAKLPFQGRVVGLRTRVKVPAEHAGRLIRLVIDHEQPDNRHACAAGLLINGVEYFRPERYAPIGPRIDRFLHPGQEDTLEILTVDHLAGNPGDLKIKGAWLEVF